MKSFFYSLADFISQQLHTDEFFMANFDHETSDFVRFNKGKIRQAGSVKQADLTLSLIADDRCVEGTLRLSCDETEDKQRITALLDALRENLSVVNKDPHLLYSTERNDSDHSGADEGFNTDIMVDSIIQQAQGCDFVGILAAGNMAIGFANALGQRNWHSNHSFNLDWSLYLDDKGGTKNEAKDKAVKWGYAGYHWDETVFIKKMAEAKSQLAQLDQQAISIDPGTYRAYLSPAALNEILSLVNWGGFSKQDSLTKQSPLQKLEETQKLNRKVSLTEHSANGIGALFQEAGYIKPDAIELIKQGELNALLCSPRTAKEYAVEHNGASDDEEAAALEMAAGDLPEADILAALGTGLYINNLWYLNYSDRSSGRFTGMTRFATFWVEDGKIVAPVNVVRFDDSIFNLLGDKLIDLSQERDFMLDAGTYEQRTAASFHLPGALVSAFKVTL